MLFTLKIKSVYFIRPLKSLTRNLIYRSLRDIFFSLNPTIKCYYDNKGINYKKKQFKPLNKIVIFITIFTAVTIT